MTDGPTELSPAGVRRRAQILRLALRESRRRRQRRLILRGGALGIALLTLVLPLSLLKFHTIPKLAPVQVRRIDPLPATQSVAQLPAPIATLPRHPRKIVITRLKTDPHIATELAVHPQAASIQRINDDQLLEQLALAHKPAGLARVNGKTVLLYAASSHFGR